MDGQRGSVRGRVPGAQPRRAASAAAPTAPTSPWTSPELQALARLIEEARALQDSPAGAAADQPVPGRALGRAGRARRRRPPGRGVAAAGPGPAVAPTAGPGPEPPAGAAGRAAPLPAGRVRLAGVPVGAPARRHPRRRHGPGQDAAVPGADLPRPGARPGSRPPFLIVAPTSVVANWAAEAARFAPGPDGGARSPAPRPAAASDARRDRRGRRRRGHLLHPAAHGLRRLRRAELVRAAAGRGAARQEPPVEDLPVRPPAGRPGQDRHHRHADGEQPDGAVVAAVDHRARAVPRARSGSATTTPGRSKDRPTRELLAQLRRRIRPLVLRRTKEQVAADLPAKQEQVLEVDLHPRHRKVYQTRTCSGSGRRSSA